MRKSHWLEARAVTYPEEFYSTTEVIGLQRKWKDYSYTETAQMSLSGALIATAVVLKGVIVLGLAVWFLFF